MTVAAVTRKQAYPGTGTTGPFTFNFRVLNKSHLLVEVFDASGIPTVITEGTGPGTYAITLTNNGTTGGSITTNDAVVSGETIIITGLAPLTQATGFRNEGAFFAEKHEDAYDKLTIIVQESRDEIDRALKVSPLVTGVNPILTQGPQDGHALIWSGPDGNIRNTSAPLTSLEGDAEVVADNIAHVINVSVNMADVVNVSQNMMTEINTVASIAAEVQDVAAIDSQIVAVAANETNINTVAGSISNVNTVAGSISNVNTVAGSMSNVNLVAGSIANVNTVAGLQAQITTLAAISSDITDAANNIPKANRNATTNPTVNDDSGDGYSEGSLWVNVTADAAFLCLDPALGAAVWQQITTGSTSASTITVVDSTWAVFEADDVQEALDEIDAFSDVMTKVIALGNISGTVNLDWGAARAWTCTFTGNTTFTFSNIPSSGTEAIATITATNGGLYDITLPASVRTFGGEDFEWTVSGVDEIAFMTKNGGTNVTMFGGSDAKVPP